MGLACRQRFCGSRGSGGQRQSDSNRSYFGTAPRRSLPIMTHGQSVFGGPTMLTAMTEEDWTIVLRVFAARAHADVADLHAG
jgi:hypothetical protein